MPVSISTSALIRQLGQTTKMYPFVTGLLSNLLSWRTVAIILALLNLKSLPLAWHLRLFGLMLRHGRPLRRNVSALEHESSPTLKATQNRIHPIFRPVSISSRVSLYETDYNFHKSNSTYFADLDHSRTALVASLLGPALAHSTLKQHGEKPGVLYPILGSVHTSFLREIKPLEAYTVRSRLLGWDRKWLIILSVFVRPPTRKEKVRAKKDNKDLGNEILLACALNKYVIKQGRKTIDPGLALAGSGWFRARPGITHAVGSSSGASKNDIAKPDSAVTTGANTPLPAPSQASVDAAETVSKVVRRLSQAGSGKPDLSISSAESDSETEQGGWTWAEIDNRRIHGLKLVDEWMKLDSNLRDEYLLHADSF